MLIWAIVFYVSSVIIEITRYCDDEYYLSSVWLVIYYFICFFLRIVANILPAIAIKNKSIKIVVIVLIVIPSIYYIFNNVYNIVNEF